MKRVLIATGLCFVVALRWAVSFHSYSGASKPPMFGDFEAQRHWMEITYNLPIQDWYTNSTDNDLLYWGLDYPPLTAYHSWLCAFIASRMNASWVELKTSRGLEDPVHKLFMRYTVLLPDLLIYIPAVFILFLSSASRFQRFNQGLFHSILMLTYPGLLLIDHAHFQYNCVSLGLLLWAVVAMGRACGSEEARRREEVSEGREGDDDMTAEGDRLSAQVVEEATTAAAGSDDAGMRTATGLKKRVTFEASKAPSDHHRSTAACERYTPFSHTPLIVSCIFFSLSLNYKQMQLYHSLPFFFFILGRIAFCHSSLFCKLKTLFLVASSVLATFLLCWLPFLSTLDGFLQVLQRLFPFDRGLFEDKVANLWCSLSVLLKLKQMLQTQALVRLCSGTTLLSVLPSCTSLFLRPSFTQFKLSLFNVSLSFFLFSYQVHEKSILLPAVAMVLLYEEHPVEVVCFLLASTLSMLPLFIKDGLVTPYISCSVFFYVLSTFRSHFAKLQEHPNDAVKPLKHYLSHVSLALMSLLSLVLLCVPPPAHLPDLFTLFVTTFSFCQFVVFLLYFTALQLLQSSSLVSSSGKQLLKNE